MVTHLATDISGVTRCGANFLVCLQNYFSLALFYVCTVILNKLTYHGSGVLDLDLPLSWTTMCWGPLWLRFPWVGPPLSYLVLGLLRVGTPCVGPSCVAPLCARSMDWGPLDWGTLGLGPPCIEARLHFVRFVTLLLGRGLHQVIL